MVEYRCSDEESFEATQIIAKIYDSIAERFPDTEDGQMILTWMLYRANLDYRVGTLYLAANAPHPSRMPGWDRLTKQIVPEIMRTDGDPDGDEEFFHTAKIPEFMYRVIVQHIHDKAIELGGSPINHQ